MATGDTSDITGRLRAYLPRGWFGDWSEAPYISALLAGIASTLAVVYTLIEFFIAQTRLGSSSGGFIDMWADDFFGTTLPRKPSETDASYIARIQARLFQKTATRPGMSAALKSLTGRAPIIFEPMRPLDTGCMGKNTGVTSFCGVARMGSLACPYQAWITVYRPRVSGGSAGAAYSNAAPITALHTKTTNAYTASLADETSAASDADIYELIEAVRPAATSIGVCITN